MKVLVDEIPKRASDCIFSEYEFECVYRECKLTEGALCSLEYGEECEKLLPMNSVIR